MNERCGVFRVFQANHERAIDFEHVDREAMQRCKGCDTGPKVINGQADAKSAKAPHLFDRCRDILHKRIFLDFQLQPRGMESCFGEHALKVQNKIASGELFG